ncbi:MAG: efflux RND transporter periplasmic adaptor subunit, partial [Myxococcales bacterium]
VSRLHRHEPEAEAKVARYHCPMHPEYTSDKPGECPICGMKLVPIASAHAQERETDVPGLAGVVIDARRQQLIGLRTAEVTKGPISGDWRTVGRVAVDETRVRKVNVKVDGFVEKLFVDFVGKPVRRGQPLFELYSPDLLAVQNDYALAVTTRAQLGGGPTGEDLVAAARRRLELWDVPRSEIAHLDHGGAPLREMTLVSPISGVVTAKTVVQGSRVVAGDTPFEITDLSQVWVLADAHESDLPRVRVGTPVSLTMEAVPNRVFTGNVKFIDPVLDAKTRTAKVRLAFKNPRGELRPEMFGDVVFHTRPHDGLRVPADSILDSGDRKVVFVSLADGRFEPREVEAGEAESDTVEVLSGVQAGERVVVRASFLVDSESRLKAALAALGSRSASKPQARSKP